jgi:DNA-binding NarL/FixJ family response regulator
MITILIADDHQIFRGGLARVLNDVPDMTVVASASNGEEALVRALETRPNVILMDLNMPVLDGVEATRRLRVMHPQSHILMLTVSEQEQHLFAAICAGARGYLLKSMSSDDLIDAIRRANAGEAIVAPVMAAKLLDEFAALSAAAHWREPGGDDLSQRERDVLRLIAQGLSNKEIGAALSLSPHTIKAHLRSILDKLQLRNRAEVAAWAARHNPPH